MNTISLNCEIVTAKEAALRSLEQKILIAHNEKIQEAEANIFRLKQQKEYFSKVIENIFQLIDNMNTRGETEGCWRLDRDNTYYFDNASDLDPIKEFFEALGYKISFGVTYYVTVQDQFYFNIKF